MNSKEAREKAEKELKEFIGKEEEQKDKQDTEKKDAEPEEPIGVILTRAKQDMTMAIIQIQNLYRLPAYLTDLIVSASLADVRDCANKDLLNAMRK